MSSDLLLQEFGRIGDTPDAIPRLRRFVMDLAVRGFITEPAKGDEPAASLLREIEKRNADTRVGARSRIRHFDPIESDEEPFHIRDGWLWLRLREITRDRGQTVPSEDFTYIDVTAIDKEAGRIRDPTVLSPSEAPSRARKIVAKGDVLYSCVRPYLLNVAVVEVDLEPPPIASTAFAVLDGLECCLPRYLWIVLRSPYFVALVESKMRGQAYPAIKDSDLAQLPVPLPPLAEQHRVVAKVNLIMELCDQIEAKLKERELQRDALRNVSLSRLIESEDDQADTRFLLNSLSQLITKPDDIETVRRAILNLAVSGRLVPQDPGEASPPASQEKVQISVPYSIPASWEWKPVSEIGTARLGKMLDKAKNRGTACPYLRNVNVRWFNFDLSDVKTMLMGESELREFELAAGDVLICEGGEPGRAAVWDGRVETMYFQKALHRLRVFDWIDGRFFVLFLRASASAGRLVAQSTGATFHHLTGQALAKVLTPVPPLAEQRRIVTKVNELMAVCDELETAFTSAQNEYGRLLELTLRDAINQMNLRFFTS